MEPTVALAATGSGNLGFWSNVDSPLLRTYIRIGTEMASFTYLLKDFGTMLYPEPPI
jgi:hypothetical protein